MRDFFCSSPHFFSVIPGLPGNPGQTKSLFLPLPMRVERSRNNVTRVRVTNNFPHLLPSLKTQGGAGEGFIHHKQNPVHFPVIIFKIYIESVIIRFVKTNVINNRGAIMMNKTILMLSVSCMSFIAGADLCYAGFNPYDTPPVLSAAMLKSHVSTHTSHLTAAHLSSPEDFAELTLPENSGLSLPKNLGNYLFYPLPENSGRVGEGFTIPPSRVSQYHPHPPLTGRPLPSRARVIE